MIKRWGILTLIIACLGVLAIYWTGTRRIAAATDNVGRATEFVGLLAKGAYADADGRFDSTMSQALPAPKLKQTWEGLIQQFGAFSKTGGTQTGKLGGYDVVYVTCEFEKGKLDAKVVFDSSGKIGGLWFAPHTSQGVEYTEPAYVHKDRFEDREVTVGSGEWALPGILSIPKGEGPFPAVVLVHGSGPNDRDETLGPNKPFRDLAGGLASRGIAVLRYDKRTKVYSYKILGSADKLTVKEETIDDALAAVSLLRKTDKVDANRIFVLGHSLGAMLIPRIAKADPRIAGLIAMAGPTRPFGDVLIEQMTYLYSLNGPLSADSKKQIEKLREQVANGNSPTLSPATPSSSLPLGAPARYWLDLRNYHPAEAAKTVKQPMMILQGGRDYQATTADFRGWKEALSSRDDVTFKFYPNLNHLFMEGEGKSTPSEYEKRGPVAQVVIDDIAGWIARQ